MHAVDPAGSDPAFETREGGFLECVLDHDVLSLWGRSPWVD